MTDSTGIAVIQDNKLLLGYRTDGQGWSLAGGKQEGSESLEECALENYTRSWFKIRFIRIFRTSKI